MIHVYIYIYLYLYSGCFIKLVSEGFKDDPRKQMKFMPDKLPVGKLPSEIRASWRAKNKFPAMERKNNG